MLQICEIQITCDIQSSQMCQQLHKVGYVGIIIHCDKKELYDMVALTNEALERSGWVYTHKGQYCCQFCEVEKP
ncbi:MAG: hypothetical protein ACE5RJ_01665 [Nitrosopumilaceae archaeon]